MKRLVIAALCTLLLPVGACATSSSDKTDNAATKKASSGALVLGDAKLFQINDPNQALVIRKDGSLVLMGKALGKIHSDGRLTGPDGQVLLTVQPDGTMKMADGTIAKATVTPDNVLVSPDGQYRVTIAADGTLKGGNPAAPAMASSGCQGAMARTCLVVMSAVMTAQPR